MEKEKAEIASLVERYGRVQSLMKYVNSDTLKESYNKQPKGKAVGVDGITKVLFCKLNDAPVVTLNDAITV